MKTCACKWPVLRCQRADSRYATLPRPLKWRENNASNLRCSEITRTAHVVDGWRARRPLRTQELPAPLTRDENIGLSRTQCEWSRSDHRRRWFYPLRIDGDQLLSGEEAQEPALSQRSEK